MAKSGRKIGYTPNAKTRDAIQATRLKNVLEEHVFTKGGTLDPSQVTGVKILLAKVLPDMQQVDQTIVEHLKLTNEEVDERIEQLTGTAPGTSPTTH